MTDQSPHMPIGEVQHYGFKRRLRGGIDWRIKYVEFGDRFVARIKKKRGAGFKFLVWTTALLFAATVAAVLFLGGSGIFYLMPDVPLIPFEIPFLIAGLIFLIVLWKRGRGGEPFYRLVIDADRVKITEGMNKPFLDAEKRHVSLFSTKGKPAEDWSLFVKNGELMVTLRALKTGNDETAGSIVGLLNAAMVRKRKSKNGDITAGSGPNTASVTPATVQTGAAGGGPEDDDDLRL